MAVVWFFFASYLFANAVDVIYVRWSACVACSECDEGEVGQERDDSRAAGSVHRKKKEINPCDSPDFMNVTLFTLYRFCFPSWIFVSAKVINPVITDQ